MFKLNSDYTERWKGIDWTEVQKTVFRLQKRIYLTSREGNVKKVRQLQKTLVHSFSAKALAVRRVTQDNQGKRTAGVDGKSLLTPPERFSTISQLKLVTEGQPLRRIWIPKPGRTEERPLGIPTVFDRCLQALVTLALEPEWEALFEPNSYGFRPGRGCHDAIKAIKLSIQSKPKFVLDADIEKCFDRIDHCYLLDKINQRGSDASNHPRAGALSRQIESWLTSGVIDQELFTDTTEGTPQGGVISPLLANIALNGMETLLKDYVAGLPLRYPNGKPMKREDKRFSISLIRYADDFVIMHESKEVVLQCRELLSAWLQPIGLRFKTEKTRLTHTLDDLLSEDGKAGFNFLGFHIKQHRSTRNSIIQNKRPLGHKTLILPSKASCSKHQAELKTIVRKNTSNSQVALIAAINPLISGWSNYFAVSDALTCGVLNNQDHLLFVKLLSWSKRQTGNKFKGYTKYWHTVNGRKTFACVNQGSKPFVQIFHRDYTGNGINQYVKVQGDRSLFDCDFVYWSTRLGRHPEIHPRKSRLLKAQKGKCYHCSLSFAYGDVMEVDHIVPRSMGGSDVWKNLQLLHRHCHHEKTRADGSRAAGPGSKTTE